jgi:hypothetical protein
MAKYITYEEFIKSIEECKVDILDIHFTVLTVDCEYMRFTIDTKRYLPYFKKKYCKADDVVFPLLIDHGVSNFYKITKIEKKYTDGYFTLVYFVEKIDRQYDSWSDADILNLFVL